MVELFDQQWLDLLWGNNLSLDLLWWLLESLLRNGSSIVALDLFGEVKSIVLLAWLAGRLNSALLLEQSAHPSFVLADKWQLVELLAPGIGDDDGVLLNSVVVDRVPLLTGMRNYGLEVVGVDGVPAVEHIGSAALPTFGICIWEELGHTG